MRREQCLDGLLDEREFEVGRGEHESSLHLLLECSGECGRVCECRLVVFGPEFVHGAKDSEESGRSIGLVAGWEVGASGDGAGIGSEEHREWPAGATSGLGHVDTQCGHVDVVDIGTFFSVDLDIHEVFVHELGDFRIGKALAFHDVAPVAAAVADREEDHLAFLAGFFECFGSPGEPVDGVVSVQQQVGAGLVGQPIGWCGIVRVVDLGAVGLVLCCGRVRRLCDSRRSGRCGVAGFLFILAVLAVLAASYEADGQQQEEW